MFIYKRWGLVEWCELGRMREMMNLGDGKWANKQTGERTVRACLCGSLRDGKFQEIFIELTAYDYFI